MTIETITATIHSINTCFVTEKSIPNTLGNCIIGCDISEFET